MKTRSSLISFKVVLVIAAAAVLGLDVSPAQATDAQADLNVTAEVSANCIISTTPVAFGAYDPVVTNASSQLNGAGKVTVTCTNGSTGVIKLGQGANFDSGSTDAAPLRRMSDGDTSYLSYGLFTNVGRTLVWGNDVGHSVSHLGDGTSTDIDVFGKIPGGQNVPAGSYADTVVATITF